MLYYTERSFDSKRLIYTNEFGSYIKLKIIKIYVYIYKSSYSITIESRVSPRYFTPENPKKKLTWVIGTKIAI